MSSIFRSETMGYYQLILPRESAWEILSELGDTGTLHYIDENPLPLINRPFANYIKRCEVLNNKCETIRDELKKWNFEIEKPPNINKLLENFKDQIYQRQKAGQTYLDELEQEIHDRNNWISHQLKNFETLQERSNSLTEYRQVLKISRNFLGNNFFNSGQNVQNIQGLEGMISARVKVNYIVGTINTFDSDRFRRMIFRVSKGNAWVNLQKMNMSDLGQNYLDPKTLSTMEKDVFLIIYPGGQMDVLKVKLSRFCDSFNCNRFGIPENEQQFNMKIKEIEQQQAETFELLKSTEHTLKKYMQILIDRKNNNCSYIEELKLYILREKSIYYAMNTLKIQNNIFHGHVWVPNIFRDQVYQCIQDINKKYPNLPGGQMQQINDISDDHSPPTYIQTNEFTFIFQEIVNTYGVPRYKEINPAVFTIITFPFQFGIMFGDIAHGALLLMAGIYLLYINGNQKSKQQYKDVLPYRYILTLMGFFAFYAGTLYNDFLSLSFNFFGSCYNPTPPEKPEEFYTYDNQCTYPYGLDPIWNKAGNDIVFINSFKMKFAVIVGVIQMIFGIFLKGLNAKYFKSSLDFVFEFLPQIIFMSLTFVYMDFMIYYKWTIDYLQIDVDKQMMTQYAPSIITLLINMAIKVGETGGNNLYPGPPTYENRVQNNLQSNIQVIFLIVAFLCIPIMLLPKPLILIRRQGKQQQHNRGIQNVQQQQIDSKEQIVKPASREDLDILDKSEDLQKKLIQISNEVHDDSHSSSEIFVHQIIETIEFVLGSISNTASYLRLWALSLAHSQLAKVFWQQIMKQFITSENIVVGAIGHSVVFLIFAGVTTFIFLCMDVMECFLHALRLHWVEFQNKFFKADGYLYQPFSFKDTIVKHYENQSSSSNL